MSKLVVIGEPLLVNGLERQPGYEFEPSSDEAAEILIDEGRAAKAGSKDAKVAEQADEKPLTDLKVSELRTLAEQREVELDGAKSKDDIIAKLEAADQPE